MIVLILFLIIANITALKMLARAKEIEKCEKLDSYYYNDEGE